MLKADPAGASGRPPARQPHDGHRGTGLTLYPSSFLPFSDDGVFD
jgi:hypothetical protein